MTLHPLFPPPLSTLSFHPPLMQRNAQLHARAPTKRLKELLAAGQRLAVAMPEVQELERVIAK